MKIIFLIIFILVILLKKKSTFTKVSTLDQIYSSKKFTTIPGNELSGIDMVYVISMPSRLEYITSEINKLKLKCTYLDAVKPGDLTESQINELSNINTPGAYMYKKITRLCVLLSFTLCYLDSIKKGYSSILVFEDDIVTKVDLSTLNKTTSEFAKSDLDFLYLGYCFMNCKQYLDPNKYEYIIPLEQDPSILCGHATCIKTKALQGIINYSFPMKKPSDEIYSDYFVKNKSKVAISKKPYFDQQTRDLMKSLNESVNTLEYCRL